MLCINMLGNNVNRERTLLDLSEIRTNINESYWKSFSEVKCKDSKCSGCNTENVRATEVDGDLDSDKLNKAGISFNNETPMDYKNRSLVGFIDETPLLRFIKGKGMMDFEKHSGCKKLCSVMVRKYDEMVNSSEPSKVLLSGAPLSPRSSTTFGFFENDTHNTFGSILTTDACFRSPRYFNKYIRTESCKVAYPLPAINFAEATQLDVCASSSENLTRLQSYQLDVPFLCSNKECMQIYTNDAYPQPSPPLSPPPLPLNPNPSRLMSMSEMNQMDVDSLNSVCGLVISTNKGNSNVKREWRNVGWYTSEEAMNAVRKQQKVSKWKSVDQINGLKVFFRCNKWKRTNCNYRMYVMYYAVDRISLNESGAHDHSTLNPDFEEKKKPETKGGTRVVVDTKPDVNQQAILDQFIKTATQNAASTSNVGQSLQVESKQEEYYDQERLSGNSSFSESARPKKKPRLNEEIPVENGDCPYQLADNINQLLQVATEIDLTFTFNARRTMEYCFESNSSEMVGKRVVFGDLGTKVYVRERINDVEQDYEEWKKADWKQFLWAVRGKCMSFFKLH